MCVCVSARVRSCTCYVLSTKISILIVNWGHCGEARTYWSRLQKAVWGFRPGFKGEGRVRVNSWRMHFANESPHKGRSRRMGVWKRERETILELGGQTYRAKGTIMDIRSLKLSGICIWLFCNLTLLQKDAYAPPVIYHSIKPLLYYSLIFANGPDQSYVCNFSRPSCASVQLQQCILVCF